MTRAPRIGLLVGLLFILAFGLILSELTNPALPEPAGASPQHEQLREVLHAQPISNDEWFAAQPVEPAPRQRARARQGDRGGDERRPLWGTRAEAEVAERPDPPSRVRQVRPQDAALTAVTESPERDGRYDVVTMDELEQQYGEAEARPSNPRTYVVQPGDTLSSIARRFLGDGSGQAVARLYQANRGWLADPDNVPAGVELVIP